MDYCISGCRTPHPKPQVRALSERVDQEVGRLRELLGREREASAEQARRRAGGGTVLAEWSLAL